MAWLCPEQHPMGNGQVMYMLQMFKTLTETQKSNWQILRNKLVYAYSCICCEVTGHLPFYLLFRKSPRLPVTGETTWRSGNKQRRKHTPLELKMLRKLLKEVRSTMTQKLEVQCCSLVSEFWSKTWHQEEDQVKWWLFGRYSSHSSETNGVGPVDLWSDTSKG